ncbi:hypothetical protein PCPL58_4304 [Pseudomonas cerasi]|uniref:Resolvase/invertase-type recombinase catalytic domain-containing protein n=1 Tax=Pseudomonas cerasi TaxID=1583341 RepID=A0A193SUP8_9PSED|nr:hypothetical protein PCPL58_4304 [Pseudomonas cerasi]SOS22848.1 hypothetical protein PL963_04397 [Pseudomonas cerasi]
MTTLNVARIYLRVSTEDQDLQRQEAIIGNRREGRPNQPSLLPSPLFTTHKPVSKTYERTGRICISGTGNLLE